MRYFAPFKPAWWAFVAVTSGLAAAYGALSTAYDAIHVGPPAGVWAAVGLLVFFLSMAVMHYHSYYRGSPPTPAKQRVPSPKERRELFWRRWRGGSPSPAPTTPESVVVSAADRDSIHKMRVIWNKRRGAAAVMGLHDLFASVISEMSSRLYWVELLKPISDRLAEKAEAFDKSLDVKSTPTLEEIVESFNVLYGHYLAVARWLYRLDRHDDAFGSSDYLPAQRARWQEAEREFRREIEALSEWDDYKNKLSIVFQTRSEASIFLGVHSAPPPLPSGGADA